MAIATTPSIVKLACCLPQYDVANVIGLARAPEYPLAFLEGDVFWKLPLAIHQDWVRRRDTLFFALILDDGEVATLAHHVLDSSSPVAKLFIFEPHIVTSFNILQLFVDSLVIPRGILDPR